MKTITFQNQEFNVPDWAKYITYDGEYCAWESKPEYCGYTFYTNNDRRRCVDPVVTPQPHEIQEIA